jgi:ABC-type transport system involved in multi-copper enzyme maturation permease subunit
MTQTRALFWKEWFEVRGFFAIALFVFLGLPLIGAAENLIARHRFDLSASTWVFGLGGVLAVFVGVGTVVRDLNGKLEEFWRSRPVSVSRWLIVKYFTGFAVLLAALLIPLAVEITVNRKRDEVGVVTILAWHPFFWAAAYSIAFVVAALVRRGAHAAMLSIAALLLLYFLPLVIPPLRFLSISWVIDQSAAPQVDHQGRILAIYHRVPWAPSVLYRPGQLWFAAAMIALCAIALAIAMIAVRQDWRVESGQKTMYWSIGGAILLVFCSAAFQVGTNLQLLQSVDLPAGTWIALIRGAGDYGVLRYNQLTAPNQWGRALIRPFTVTSSGIELGPEAEVNPHLNWYRTLQNPEHADVLYLPSVEEPGKESGQNFPTLTTVVLEGSNVHTTTQAFPEQVVGNEAVRQWWSADELIWDNKLYLLGAKLMTFDLSEPQNPRLLSARPLDWLPYSRNLQVHRFLQNESEDTGVATLPLPPIPGLPARQRLELGARTFDGSAILSGEALVRLAKGRITNFRIEQLTDSSVTIRRLGQSEPTALQLLMGSSSSTIVTRDGLLFESFSSGQLGGEHLEIFDLMGSRPRTVAHFALPHENQLIAIYPLADGRTLLAGRARLYLLSPPPGR